MAQRFRKMASRQRAKGIQIRGFESMLGAGGWQRVRIFVKGGSRAQSPAFRHPDTLRPIRRHEGNFGGGGVRKGKGDVQLLLAGAERVEATEGSTAYFGVFVVQSC